MAKPGTTKRRSGFSIIEVVFACSLLIVAMIPILRSLAYAHSSSAAVERKTTSLILAQGKLDKVKAHSIYYYSESLAETDTVLAGSYLCNVTDDADPNLRTVTVSVGYDGDSDTTLDAAEVEAALATKLARRW